MAVVGIERGLQWSIDDLNSNVTGMEGVARVLLRRIQESMPGEVGQLERELALDAGSLSTGPTSLIPNLYRTGNRDRLEPEEFPVVLAVPVDTPVVRRADLIDGDLIHHIEYNLRVWFYVRGATFEETEAARNRLALLIRRALTRRSILADNARLEPSAYRESYGDVVSARDARSLSGGTIDVRVITDETLPMTITAESVHSANTIDIDEQVLP